MPAAFKTFIQDIQTHIEAQLNAALPTAECEPSIIHQCMRHGVQSGGKRFRPALIYATANALGLPQEQVDSLAVAVELIHAYSLIHDDLPAMDDDKLRRGQPTCHILYGEANAILAGDALQALAFEVIANDKHLDNSLKVKLIADLAHASGTYGMAGGQVLDLIAEQTPADIQRLQTIHRMKTGALIKACVSLTANIAHTDEQTTQALEQFAEAVGLAFQVQDDILDVTASTATLGKPQGADMARDKSTYVSLLGLDGARAEAKRLQTEAQHAITSTQLDAPLLLAIADFAVNRQY